GGAPLGGVAASDARGVDDDRAVHRCSGRAAAHVSWGARGGGGFAGGGARAAGADDGEGRRLRGGGRGLGQRETRRDGRGRVGGGALEEALEAAHQPREETGAGAGREAQVIVREAQAEAQRILDGARASQGEVERQSADVQRQFQAYVAGFRALLERQLAELR